MDNIRQLPRLMVFSMVARKGSFTQAAAELGITKSAVSQQIKLLESELGVRLLNRTTRGVSITGLGEKMLLRCQLLQDQVNLLFADIVDAGANPKGRFRITFPHALESNVVMSAVEQFCIEYPELEPELMVSDSNLDLVSNHLDVAIHAGELLDSSYHALPIGTMTELFCATPLYLHRSSTLKTLEDLCKHRWIATSWQHQNMQVVHRNHHETSIINLNQIAQTNTLPSALKMALHHMGFVLLPDVIARPLIRTGELIRIVEHVTGPQWSIHFLHTYQSKKPVHITRFYQLVCCFFNRFISK